MTATLLRLIPLESKQSARWNRDGNVLFVRYVIEFWRQFDKSAHDVECVNLFGIIQSFPD